MGTKDSSSQFASIPLSCNFSSQTAALWDPLLPPQQVNYKHMSLRARVSQQEGVMAQHTSTSITKKDPTQPWWRQHLPARGQHAPWKSDLRSPGREGFGNGLGHGQISPLGAEERQTGAIGSFLSHSLWPGMLPSSHASS